MINLVLGLVLFLGIHSLRVVANDWRQARVEALGIGIWRAITVLISLTGLALIVWGYDAARAAPIDMWQPASEARHLAGLLTLLAVMLITASFVPGSRVRGLAGHALVLGVMVWAFGHLIANGRLADLLLFGGILLWAAFLYVSLRRRDRAAGTVGDRGSWVNDLVTVMIGLVLWTVFALHLHSPLIGVPPFG